MNKRIIAGSLAFPFLGLLAWTIFLSYQMNIGREIKVAIAGYDPVDLLAGHYIQYQIDWSKTDCRQFPNNTCPKESYFCEKARWGDRCRFYIPEQYAEDLDKIFRSQNTDNLRFEVIYAYTPNATPIAKQLLINGKDWHDYIK